MSGIVDIITGGGGPAPPELPPLPEPPKEPPKKNDPRVAGSKSRSRKIAKARAGRASTLATRGSGLTDDAKNTARKTLLGV